MKGYILNTSELELTNLEHLTLVAWHLYRGVSVTRSIISLSRDFIGAEKLLTEDETKSLLSDLCAAISAADRTKQETIKISINKMSEDQLNLTISNSKENFFIRHSLDQKLRLAI